MPVAVENQSGFGKFCHFTDYIYSELKKKQNKENKLPVIYRNVDIGVC